MADRFEGLIVDAGAPPAGGPQHETPPAGPTYWKALGELAARMHAVGCRTALVTAGRHPGSPGIADEGVAASFDPVQFDVAVHQGDADRLALAALPDPAILLEAAQRAGVPPGLCAVISASPRAIQAGRRGRFGLVVGIEQGGDGQGLTGDAQGLAAAGADIVVADPADLAVEALCGQRDPWVLAYRGFDEEGEGTREALLTVGNGYMATRGAMPHTPADAIHYPGTYVAGIYNRLTSTIEGRSREDESMVNLPNWTALTFRACGEEWVSARAVLSAHRVALDLKAVVLTREATVVDASGRRTQLIERRLVSMSEPHLAAIELRLVPKNWSGRLDVRSVVDGRVSNTNVPSYRRLSAQHLETIQQAHEGQVAFLVAQTVQSRIRVGVAVRTAAPESPGPRPGAVLAINEPGVVGHQLSFEVTAGQEVLVEKVAGVVTSRDRAISEASAAAVQIAREAPPFATIMADHLRSWEDLWQRFRVDLSGIEDETLAVRVHLVHLLQTLSPHTTDLDAGVPARGLHGEAYRGHVFWDELFVFPLLNFRLPELTRSLLLYRWRRLPESRRRALAIGCRGALFAWQSGSDGREETPVAFFNPRSGRWVTDNSHRQYHVNVAVAYNVWLHWQVTTDLGFLVRNGAELLIETARFFASAAAYDPGDDRYDLRGIMGPDEFHDGYPGRPGQGIDNNAYVNVMASWALTRACDVYAMLGAALGKELRDRLHLDDQEVEHWDHVSRRLRVPFLRNRLLAQFEGYDDLEEFDLARYEERYGDIGRLDLILEAEGDSTNRYQVSKQADALMLFYLLSAEELSSVIGRMGYDFDTESIPDTVDYYLARTSHGSSLSRVAHAWVLARSDRARSWRLLQQAFTADLAGTRRGTTCRGIHLGAMAGSLDLLERCYSGLDTHGGALRFNPLLPDEIATLEMALRYRNQIITVHIDHSELRLDSAPGPAPAITVALGDDHRRLSPGRSVVFPVRRRRHSVRAAVRRVRDIT